MGWLKERNKTVHMMGTTITLSVTHPAPEKIINEMIFQLQVYEQRFSANDVRSELSEINKNAGIQPITVHPELYELTKIGKFHSVAQDSHLNIAIGPLVQTWRIGFDDARVPSEDEVQNLLNRINPHEILLDDAKQSVFLRQKGMAIDLGSLAKGYIADRLIDYLRSVEATSALINLGGNLVSFGPALKRADQQWRIGIQNPVHSRGNTQIILKLQNKSVVTSGIYERHLEKNGQTFHHIFDSQTGYPIETKIASLTIISDLSIDGEIWTTRLFGFPIEKIINILNQLEGIDGVVISNSGQVAYSEGVKALIIE